MIVYQSDVVGFRKDVLTNRIEEQIHRLFFVLWKKRTSPAEVAAWKNSLGFMDRILADATAPDDAGVAIELQIPGSAKRMDFVLSGLNSGRRKTAIVIELKQWSEVKRSPKDAIVETFVGGRVREMLHPSYQAWSYTTLLYDFNEAVREAPIELHPCAYLHNCESGENVRHRFYDEYTNRAPIFLRDDATVLREFIRSHVKYGDKGAVLFEILNGRIRPSKNLADSLSSLLAGNPEFTLIDDQKEVFEAAIHLAAGAQQGQKKVLIVEGGPGTGKSVVAVNLLVTFTNKRLTAKYVTKNAAPRAVYESRLTGTLRKTRISNLFGGPDAFVSAAKNSFGALIVDEAHRLRAKAGLYGNLGENLIKHLIESAHFTTFFVDDAQRVTLKDIGGVEEIERWALALGADVTRMQLSSQFRCGGSDGYLGWVDHTLGIRETANPTLIGIDYKFRVCDSATELRDLIRRLNRGDNKARMVAGYCWQWRSKKNPELLDVEIPSEGFAARWNLSEDGGTWIIRPDSVEQIGCIHTCQGLEVDYVGVILGHDLVIRKNEWVEFPERRAKQDLSIRGYGKLLLEDRLAGQRKIREVIRNTYRTLMTRGARGCLVFSVDPETNEYLRRAVGRELDAFNVAEPVGDTLPNVSFQPLKISPTPLEGSVPCFDSLDSVVCRGPGEKAVVEKWVELPDTYRIKPGMFVAKVSGDSMNRRIPNGSWCLFVAHRGSAEGKIVLVKRTSLTVAEGEVKCVVRRYMTASSRDGQAVSSITLWPDSHDRTYRPTAITAAESTEVEILGEFVAVL